MGIARRQFLQAGLTSLIGWQFLTGDRVALAAEQYLQQATSSTQRKKALLIGINQYEAKEDSSSTSSQNGAANGWLPLHGCVNDVELQKELLIYRFGFAPQDIVTLTDRDATRHNITEAITEHLTAQTLPDDLVLVHFSGHGSRLGNYNTLVPVDSGLPQIQDITELEWRRALQAIATDKILCVIDAGFYYPNVSTIGNFRLRSRIGRSDWQLPPELALIEKQAIATNTVANSGTNPIGVFLQAASGDMLCADAQWSGFSSGAFTYSLVQQMWQITPATTIHWVMSNLVTNLDRRILHNENLSIDKQIMEMMETNGVKSKEISTNTFASLLPIPDFGADGVVTNISNDRLNNDRRSADVCLAGLPIDILTNYMAGSILNVNSNANSNVTVQLKSRNGFNGKVEVLSDRNSNPKLESGQLLQESIRAISRNLKLAIALDVGLSKIERVDATSAFSTLPNMFGVNANEQCADCLFGVQSASYGLFTVGHQPILGSFGSVGESVGVAIKRLQCFLESLLAAKLIRITENQAASHLNVRATIKAIVGIDERSVTIASKSAARAVRIPVNDTINNTVRTKPINIGDRLECQIENFSDQPLYTRIFCLDPRGKVLTPNFIATPYSNDGVIAPSETLTIPYPKAMMNWGVSAPQGNVDVQVVISRSPLWEIAKVLELSQRQTSSINGLIAIPNPLQVAQALLVDLDRAGKSSKSSDLNSFSNASDTWMLDVQQWATFNFSYQVV
jgi:hypothetical protein